VWLQHWGLTRDPFAEQGGPYVRLPSHDEAVARLAYSIEASLRRVVLAAPEGLGKTTVLRQALAETRSPSRRFAVVSRPEDGACLFWILVEKLGARLGVEPSRVTVWRELERAIRARSLEGFQVILAIDECDAQTPRLVRQDLAALARLAPNAAPGLTIIQVERTGQEREPAAQEAWTLAVGLEPLTVSQAKQYLLTKLRAAGSGERIFTPRAITRLQCLSRGVPRGLERLATLSLMAGAVRSLEVIPPDVIDGVAIEFSP
jgi:MSHA biogenesis protein MshM